MMIGIHKDFGEDFFGDGVGEYRCDVHIDAAASIVHMRVFDMMFGTAEG